MTAPYRGRTVYIEPQLIRKRSVKGALVIGNAADITVGDFVDVDIQLSGGDDQLASRSAVVSSGHGT